MQLLFLWNLIIARAEHFGIPLLFSCSVWSPSLKPETLSSLQLPSLFTNIYIMRLVWIPTYYKRKLCLILISRIPIRLNEMCVLIVTFNCLFHIITVSRELWVQKTPTAVWTYIQGYLKCQCLKYHKKSIVVTHFT